MTNSEQTPGLWSLHFDRDGTEDVAVIHDADGEELLRSRPFWLPEGDDPVPSTLAAVRLVVAAPDLLALAKQIVRAKDTEESVPVALYNAAVRVIALIDAAEA